MTTRVLDQIPAGTFYTDEKDADSRPEWLRQKGIEVRTTDFPQHAIEHAFGDRGLWQPKLCRIPYTVLPSDWHPSALELPFFVGFVDDVGRRHYFVSEDLNQQYADLWVLHEGLEFAYAQFYDEPSPPFICQEALMNELAIAELMGVDMKTYILQRYEFFTHLVAFHEKHQQITEGQLHGMKKSLKELQARVEMMNI